MVGHPGRNSQVMQTQREAFVAEHPGIDIPQLAEVMWADGLYSRNTTLYDVSRRIQWTRRRLELIAEGKLKIEPSRTAEVLREIALWEPEQEKPVDHGVIRRKRQAARRAVNRYLDHSGWKPVSKPAREKLSFWKDP